MKKTNNYMYILIFVLMVVLAFFFPLTGEDLFWSNANISTLVDTLKTNNLGLLTSSLLITITKIKLIRLLTIGVVSTSLFFLIKNIVNKRNASLLFIGIFFLFLFDKQMLSNIFVNTTGFTTHLIGSLFLLIFIKLFNNNSIVNMKSILLILLGLLSTILYPLYSFTIFITTIFYIISIREPDFKTKYMTLLSGEVIGILLTVFTTKLAYTGFSYNLLHELMPSLRGTNFFLLLISSSLILYESIKIFKGNKRLPVGLSVLSILSFLLISLLNNNDIILYISYICYFLGTYYILSNIKTNKLFKYKIRNYYFFKLVFIILLSLFGNINSGSILFLYLIDIIIILEIYNKILPQNYLKYAWAIAATFLIVINIYLYSNALNKHIVMNRYIKNELECHTEEIIIPNRFETDYIYKNIPRSEDELKNYIEFYNIDVYNKNRKIKMDFSK